MELSTCLTIYMIVVVITTMLLNRVGIKTRSAVILGLIAGQTILNILVPPTNLNPWGSAEPTFNSYSAIYLVIQLLTPVIVIIYSVYIGLHDSVNCSNGPPKELSHP